MRILLIEDDTELAKLVAEILQSEGHEVAILSGADADDLVGRASAHAHDLVLLDLGLGELRGAALLNRLASTSKHPAIVLCTGASEQEISPLRSQVDGILRKPFGIDELLATVGEIASRGDPKSGPRISATPAKRSERR